MKHEMCECVAKSMGPILHYSIEPLFYIFIFCCQYLFLSRPKFALWQKQFPSPIYFLAFIMGLYGSNSLAMLYALSFCNICLPAMYYLRLKIEISFYDFEIFWGSLFSFISMPKLHYDSSYKKELAKIQSKKD